MKGHRTVSLHEDYSYRSFPSHNTHGHPCSCYSNYMLLAVIPVLCMGFYLLNFFFKYKKKVSDLWSSTTMLCFISNYKFYKNVFFKHFLDGSHFVLMSRGLEVQSSSTDTKTLYYRS